MIPRTQLGPGGGVGVGDGGGWDVGGVGGCNRVVVGAVMFFRFH